MTTFVKQEPTPINPYGLTDVQSDDSSPRFTDIDGDGDLDAFIGDYDGNTQFFQNTGSKTSPSFAAATSNPFGLTNVGYDSSPTFADIDGDGDFDAFIGDNDGNTQFFQNTGSKTSPSFAAATANPFGLTNVGSESSPTFADIDGDGDLDAFIGDYDGNTQFFQNTGSKTSPSFAAATSNPFGLTNVGYDSSPTFADIDGDGDFDAFIGDNDGNTQFFQNTGSKTSPSFAAATANPFGLTDAGSESSPTFADIDGDGDLDAFIGEDNGDTQFFQNTGSNTSPSLVSPQSFGLADVGSESSPTFADIDGDGDLDAFIGEGNGNTQFFQNTGSNTSPSFAAATANPFGLADVGFNSSPTFADIDGDGDLDAFIGDRNGNTQFFQNTGSNTSPSFAAATANPFGLTNVGNNSSPTFADIDGDGDFDAFIGDYDGNTQFFQNTGSKTSPSFAAATANPFGLAAVGNYSSPTFADIDGDGDLDAFIGDKNGNTQFFQNTGSKTSPSFAAATANPFGLTNVGDYSSPTFADIDGDGDLDAFIGERNGFLIYFKNTTPIVSIAPGTTPSEAGTTTGTFNLTLSAPAPAGGLTVNYTATGGTATPNDDYTALTGTVTFAANATTAQISVIPVDDAMIDPDETVIVNLSAGTDYIVDAVAKTASLTITDNDFVDLTINNSAPTTAVAGAPYNYTLTVSNGGTVNATGVAAQFTLPSDVTYNSATGSNGFATPTRSGSTLTFTGGSIAARENATLTVNVTPTATGTVTSAVGAASVDPSHTIAESDETNNASTTAITTTITAAPIPDLTISSSAPTTATIGTPYTYALTANNTGTANVTGVGVQFTLPSGVTYNSATISNGFATPTLSGSTLTFTGGSINAGSNATLTIDVTPTTVGTVNGATAEIDPGNAIAESDETNNTAAAIATTVSASDLTVSNIAPTTAVAGNPYTYTLVVDNTGSANATGVGVQFTLPSGVTYNTATVSNGFATPTLSGSTLTFTGGSIAAGSNATLTVNVTPSAAGVVNGATAVVDPGNAIAESNETNNTAAATTTTVLASDLTVSNIAPTTVVAGTPYNYTLTVGNSGIANATGVVAQFTLPSGVTYNSATGSNGFATPTLSGSTLIFAGGSIDARGNATLTVNVTPTATGTITSAVGAAIVDPNNTIAESDETNNVSTRAVATTVTATPVPELTISSSAPTLAVAGTPYAYTLAVNNSGTANATGVAAQFTLPSGVTYNSATGGGGFTPTLSGSTLTFAGGSIAAGGNAILTVNVTPTATGTVTSAVGAASVDPNNTIVESNETNNASTTAVATTVTATPVPELTLSSSAPALAVAGTPYAYTLAVNNSGTANATGVAAQFTLPSGVTYNSATGGGGFTPTLSGSTLTFTGGSIAAGGNAILTVNVTPTATGTVTSAVGAAIVDPSNTIAESDETNNTSTTVVTTAIAAAAIADLNVSSSAPTTAVAGTPYAYTLTVGNRGNANSTGVVTQFTLPDGVTYNSATATNGFATPTLSGSTLTFTGGSIDAGGNATLTVNVTPTATGTVTSAVNAAIVDPSNTIAESDETNNASTSAVTTAVAAVATSEIEVLDGFTNITDGASAAIDFGNTPLGTPLINTFTINNIGSADLTLGTPTLPTGFSLVGTLPGSIAAGSSANLQVQLDAATADTFDGTLLFANNDSNENPFDFPIRGTVNFNTPPTLVQKANKIFQLQGDSGQAQLQFTKVSASASFANEIGVFVVDDDAGTIDGIAPGEAGYLSAAFARSQTIFSVLTGAVDDTSTRQLGFNVGDRLGFYLVQNSSTDTVKADLAAGETPPDVFFAFLSGNADNFDHLQVSPTSNGAYTLGWEDLTGGSDADFNDLIVNVEVTSNSSPVGTGLQSQQELIDLRDPLLGSAVGANLTISSEAASDNLIGLYTIDDATGRIGNLNPGDPGYAQAALQRSVVAGDRSTPTLTAQLTGNTLLAPFLIANGTDQQFLAQNPTNQQGSGPNAYFAYLGANPDRVDHIRLLGNNMFGCEDVFGGGDRDFNDVVLQVRLQAI